MPRENLNPYKIARLQFERAARRLGLDEGMRAILSTPKRELTVSIPVRMDDGKVQVGFAVADAAAAQAALG